MMPLKCLTLGQAGYWLDPHPGAQSPETLCDEHSSGAESSAWCQETRITYQLLPFETEHLRVEFLETQPVGSDAMTRGVSACH